MQASAVLLILGYIEGNMKPVFQYINSVCYDVG